MLEVVDTHFFQILSSHMFNVTDMWFDCRMLGIPWRECLNLYKRFNVTDMWFDCRTLGIPGRECLKLYKRFNVTDMWFDCRTLGDSWTRVSQALQEVQCY